MELDVITVQIVPEKKGLFLKHSEYEIKSMNHRTTVVRRYSDFDTLFGLLIARSPYRMIPRLPPKKLMLDSLLEERRKGLQRWLRIVSRHPVLGKDSMFSSFLSESADDHQEILRQLYLHEPDEFAQISQDFALPLEDQGRLAGSRECMRVMLHAVTNMKRLAEQQAQRTQSRAREIEEMSHQMRLIGVTDGVFEPNTFTDMVAGFKEAAQLSEASVALQQSAISERFALLIETLTAHSDLCDRVEKGIVSDHQKAMSKMLTLNKQRMKGVIRGTDAENVAAIHEKEVVQNEVVGSLERRSAFSLHCVLQETSLAHEALRALPSIMLSFTYEQHKCDSHMAKEWEAIIAKEADKIK